MLIRLRDARELRRIDASRKLVIAAHPDDETFWAGLTLAGGGWSAAVLTHRSTKWRRDALRRALSLLGATGAIFDLQDSHWNDLSPQEHTALLNLVDRLVSLPNLTDVMTHSPDGETGHPFHKLISEIVTARIGSQVRLHYFSFSEEFSGPRDMPELWSRKSAAMASYIAATPGDIGNDALHMRLSAYEKPVLATEYRRPGKLIRSVYAGSTVPNASISD